MPPSTVHKSSMMDGGDCCGGTYGLLGRGAKMENGGGLADRGGTIVSAVLGGLEYGVWCLPR